MILFQAIINYGLDKCDNSVSGNRNGPVGLKIGGKTRSWIQPFNEEYFISYSAKTDIYQYCIPISKMQTDDNKWETINFVPDKNGVSSSF